VRLLQRFNSFSLAPDFMPAGSLPPAHWAGMPGRQGVEKIHPAINFTMHSKVRAVVAYGLASFLFSFFLYLLCSFRSLMLRRRIPFLTGFSIYRVASGYLPNPRLRCRHHHLKFPLRLLLKRPRPPPRWRRPRLGELFTLSRARGGCFIYMRSQRVRASCCFKKESQGNGEEKKRFESPFLVCKDD
jgi:hypothetical protein